MCSSTMASPSTATRSVRFGVMEIITFALTLGDNPSVSDGLPLAMGEPLHSETESVDAFECNRSPRRRTRSLLISKEEREEIVLSQQLPAEEVYAVLFETRRLRNQRKEFQEIVVRPRLKRANSLDNEIGEGQKLGCLLPCRQPRRQSSNTRKIASFTHPPPSSFPCRMPERQPSLRHLDGGAQECAAGNQ